MVDSQTLNMIRNQSSSSIRSNKIPTSPAAGAPKLTGSGGRNVSSSSQPDFKSKVNDSPGIPIMGVRAQSSDRKRQDAGLKSGNTSRPESSQTSQNGVNVKVIVRCRPTDDMKHRKVVSCKSDTKEIVVCQQFGSRKSETYDKTFTFDGVCGPEFTQKDIFSEYVVPIVDEVLEGFNCTIFAYGQTGTGKTYTMEGDWQRVEQTMKQKNFPSPEFVESPVIGEQDDSGLPDSAGIIPRAVSFIFSKLKQTSTEYSVKVSHLEIYNEDLNDLLNDAPLGEKPQLRIFDTGGMGGTVNSVNAAMATRGLSVERLEEVTVHNWTEVYTILASAVKKRKTAETLLNKMSSRSHTIFTITIHLKEVTVDGEDVLKIGKLNLVDLAGSENIMRSGAAAVKDRTKEAGMINQSLLTLGRVINALVEHSSFVPYRDSKLTRLLQDSLGGRTKTCILATITPLQNCLEETLSTLDYAFRAKNIRNRPEVNQRTTKRVVLRELTMEIEKLKLELMWAREKSGSVFLSTERYAEIEANIQRLTELTQTQRDEILTLNTLLTESDSQLALFKSMAAKEEKANNILRRQNKQARDQITAQIALLDSITRLANREKVIGVVKSTEADYLFHELENRSEIGTALENAATRFSQEVKSVCSESQKALQLIDCEIEDAWKTEGRVLEEQVQASKDMMCGIVQKGFEFGEDVDRFVRAGKEAIDHWLNECHKILIDGLKDQDVDSALIDFENNFGDESRAVLRQQKCRSTSLLEKLQGILERETDAGKLEAVAATARMTSIVEKLGAIEADINATASNLKQISLAAEEAEVQRRARSSADLEKKNSLLELILNNASNFEQSQRQKKQERMEEWTQFMNRMSQWHQRQEQDDLTQVQQFIASLNCPVIEAKEMADAAVLQENSTLAAGADARASMEKTFGNLVSQMAAAGNVIKDISVSESAAFNSLALEHVSSALTETSDIIMTSHNQTENSWKSFVARASETKNALKQSVCDHISKANVKVNLLGNAVQDKIAMNAERVIDTRNELNVVGDNYKSKVDEMVSCASVTVHNSTDAMAAVENAATHMNKRAEALVTSKDYCQVRDKCSEVQKCSNPQRFLKPILNLKNYFVNYETDKTQRQSISEVLGSLCAHLNASAKPKDMQVAETLQMMKLLNSKPTRHHPLGRQTCDIDNDPTISPFISQNASPAFPETSSLEMPDTLAAKEGETSISSAKWLALAKCGTIQTDLESQLIKEGLILSCESLETTYSSHVGQPSFGYGGNATPGKIGTPRSITPIRSRTPGGLIGRSESTVFSAKYLRPVSPRNAVQDPCSQNDVENRLRSSSTTTRAGRTLCVGQNPLLHGKVSDSFSTPNGGCSIPNSQFVFGKSLNTQPGDCDQRASFGCLIPSQAINDQVIGTRRTIDLSKKYNKAKLVSDL